MHFDIAVYKCLVDERLEKIKNETYGKRCYDDERVRNAPFKLRLMMMLNALF